MNIIDKPDISKWRRLKKFVADDLWDINTSSIPRLPRMGVDLLRVAYLVIVRFRADKLPVHASALTLATLIAIVPLLALSLSMAKGLGAGDELLEQLETKLENFEEELNQQRPILLGPDGSVSPTNTLAESSPPAQMTDYMKEVLDQVESADFFKIGGIGGLILLIIVIQMLGSIEASFNTVWGISTSRSFIKKVTNYISTLVVVPVLFLAAGTITAAFEPLVNKLGMAEAFQSILRFSPYFAAWLAFSFLYVFMPNTRVGLKPALISGAIAAILWLFWVNFYIKVQPGVGNTNFIYGGLAAVPIFIAWLYMCWVIVLLGAEIAFAVQNHSTFQHERSAYGASLKAKRILALGLVGRAAEAMVSDVPPLNVTTFAKEKNMSVRFINEIKEILVKAGLLAEKAEDQDTFMLLKAPDKILVNDVLDIVNNEGATPEELGLTRLDPRIKKLVDGADQDLRKSLDNLSIKTLIENKITKHD